MKTFGLIVVAVLMLVLVCCLCALGLLAYAGYTAVTSPELQQVTELLSATQAPTAAPNLLLAPVPTPLPGNLSTLAALLAEPVPESDLRRIAMRLHGLAHIPAVVSETAANYQIGDTVQFWAANNETDENFLVTARLIYETPHVYFFAEEGLRLDLAQVGALVDEFEEHTYPTTRSFFGSEWNPGVDGDPHLYILYARNLGVFVAGYYSSVDEYSRLVHEFSNEKEMFYINADVTGPDDPSLPGTLAHEFQHMIHWANDRNEDTWLNEGSSVLAEFLNGHGVAGFDVAFVREPDTQLNAWREDNNASHYGAGFLFMAYFLDRFGEPATRALVNHPDNGFGAVDAVLQEIDATDPRTGAPIRAIDLFADWVIANFLGDTSAADGRYGYHIYPQSPTARSATERIASCPLSPTRFTVHQFAADYFEIECQGSYTVTFTGSRQTRVAATEPHSGRYVFWSNRQDESDTTLTRAFDLTGVSRATLTYWAWWSIEENFDYAYVEVSTDGGSTWRILPTPSGTAFDPNGNNFGWGYHHNSGGDSTPRWVQETVDLTQFAGEEVQIRFEYITDVALNFPGFLLDDLSIPEIGYVEDFESGDGGWDGQGWVRIDNLLPQTWIVQIIQAAGQTVTRLPLTEEHGTATLTGPAVLVVSGTTPFTTEVATYEIALQ